MNKPAIFGAAVLLVAVLLVYFMPPSGGAAPDTQASKMYQLVDMAERMCLSNTRDKQAADLSLTLSAARSGIKGATSIEKLRAAERGAAARFTAALAQVENADIRACMEPWGAKIRDLAGTM
ncbi:hypothetical protein [Duganella callida]|uniref:Uncharacterized protein n=1 Tax=Duganella callida TaxID=2561932 RepID=A0A4Y9SZ97_9BURK|nr:hypothetical protein [Duganella callida]TFW29943.1 hypothetical protein E4L98_03020 [Duganella callida]